MNTTFRLAIANSFQGLKQPMSHFDLPPNSKEKARISLKKILAMSNDHYESHISDLE